MREAQSSEEQPNYSKWTHVCPRAPSGLIHLVTQLAQEDCEGINSICSQYRASQVVLVVKNPPANAEGIIVVGLIPRLGRSPGGEHSSPLQYSCLENPMDRGAWRATDHRVPKELEMTEAT